MTLISADKHHVRILLSHEEFDLLKGYVEHAAEHDHQMVFNHPELLHGFRESVQQMIKLWEEGAFDYDE